MVSSLIDLVFCECRCVSWSLFDLRVYICQKMSKPPSAAFG